MSTCEHTHACGRELPQTCVTLPCASGCPTAMTILICRMNSQALPGGRIGGERWLCHVEGCADRLLVEREPWCMLRAWRAAPFAPLAAADEQRSVSSGSKAQHSHAFSVPPLICLFCLQGMKGKQFFHLMGIFFGVEAAE